METVQVLKAVCPEDRSSLSVVKVEGLTQYCVCEKGHKVTVAAKDGRVVSVSFPFVHLTKCGTCGESVEIVSDQTKEAREGKELIRLVQYRCVVGHITPNRAVIQKRFSRCHV